MGKGHCGVHGWISWIPCMTYRAPRISRWCAQLYLNANFSLRMGWHSFVAACSDAIGVLERQHSHSSLSKIPSVKKVAFPVRSHSLIKGSHSDWPDLPRPLSRTKGSECPLDVKKPFESVHIMRDDKKRNIDGNLCSGDHYERVRRPIEG